MNGQTLVDEVREAKRTELDRLGSEKALLAVTDADLSTGTVLETIALSIGGLRTTVAGWAEESTGRTREVFADATESLEQEYDRLVAELDGEPAGETPAPVEAVRTFDRPVERVAAAFVGHGLVCDGTFLQAVSFFVNEADRSRADLVRDLRTGANNRVADGATALDALCAGADEWNRARTAASDVIETAYREYVETLGELGIDPKPVC